MIDKNSLIASAERIFSSSLGTEVLGTIEAHMTEFFMHEYIKNGVVIGLSGGADSVLLLIFLLNLKKRMDFTLKAIHVNHMIRGSEADHDEDFCRELCFALGVEFVSVKRDVPALSKENKCGLEEAARNARYEEFRAFIENDDSISTIATAHNATDNLETFIFNMLRGSGLSGLCAIAPVKGNIIRPLLSVPKSKITSLLGEAKIPFVTDSTNFSCEYSRNYIRNEILPKLGRLTPVPEDACTRAIENLRRDREYLDCVADDFLNKSFLGTAVDTEQLLSLPIPILVRVLRGMAAKVTDKIPERKHIDSIRELLGRSSRFEVDLPGEVSFFCRGDRCFISKREVAGRIEGEYILSDGENRLPDFGIDVFLSDTKEISSSNVYNFSIQADLSSAIILGDIRVRTRRNGDAYFYGGIHRKVKKLMNDKKIPPEKRDRIPVFFDDKGILWIPGFGVRDDSPSEKRHKWITVCQIDPCVKQ
ncbi:MAG: tRNA lysidine(34) synthetase TilS [Ruminococcaceae bacterium]|nr:tRNA lysidine(34) synthetase TilS [Oscillospiraceae bacterium]